MVNLSASVRFHHDNCGRAIADDVHIGANVHLGNNVVIYPKVKVNDGAMILDNAVLGRLPTPTRTTTRPVISEYQELVIGQHSIIGSNAVLYTGSRIGDDVLIGDLSSLREGCAIGKGAIIGRGVMVLYECTIGDYARIQDQAHLVGNALIESHVFIGMGATMANDNDIYLSRFGLSNLHLQGPIIRKYAVIGTGATLLAGIEIGRGAMVAAGAVATKSVDPWTVVGGIPARPLREIPETWRAQVEKID